MSREDIAHLISRLRSQFVGRTSLELQGLVRIFRSPEEPPSMDQIEHAYWFLHRLAGTAGTFGFVALGSRAGLLEQKLRPVVESRGAGSGKEEEVLDSDFFFQIQSLGQLLETGE